MNNKIVKPTGELANKFKGNKVQTKISLKDYGFDINEISYKPTKFIKVNGDEFTVRSCISTEIYKLEVDESVFKKDDDSLSKINKNISKHRKNFGKIDLKNL